MGLKFCDIRQLLLVLLPQVRFLCLRLQEEASENSMVGTHSILVVTYQWPVLHRRLRRCLNPEPRKASYSLCVATLIKELHI